MLFGNGGAPLTSGTYGFGLAYDATTVAAEPAFHFALNPDGTVSVHELGRRRPTARSYSVVPVELGALVVRFLVAQGLRPDALSAAGYGELDPISPNDSTQNRQKNRRIEITLARCGSIVSSK